MGKKAGTDLENSLQVSLQYVYLGVGSGIACFLREFFPFFSSSLDECSSLEGLNFCRRDMFFFFCFIIIIFFFFFIIIFIIIVTVIVTAIVIVIVIVIVIININIIIIIIIIIFFLINHRRRHHHLLLLLPQRNVYLERVWILQRWHVGW